MRGKKSKAKMRRERLGLEPPKDPIQQARGEVGVAVRDGLVAKENVPAVYAAVKAQRLAGQPLIRARLALTNAAPSASATIIRLMRDTRQKGEVRLAAAKYVLDATGVPVQVAPGAGELGDTKELMLLASEIKQELTKRAAADEARTIEGEVERVPDAGPAGAPDQGQEAGS